jgi:hypothetical protein
MAWRKMGMIFDLQQYHIPWLKSHAMLPTPLLLDDRIRVYYTGRDKNGQSRISYVDLERSNPSVVMYVHELPLLELGKIGTFDDSGTLATCAVRTEKEIYLYYNGYNRRVTVPYSNAIGVAMSRDNGETFTRIYEGPVIDRNMTEPYFTVGAFVLREGNLWHMWYASATKWIIVKEKAESVYVIKYACSADGITWKRENITCIHPLSPEEANARAAVVNDGGNYKMWFTYRGSQDFRDGSDSYRIGYATSADAVHWARRDEDAGITYSDEGWDSRMQTYPSVVDVNGKRYLFYNGNGFGQAGFGCAKWEG